MIIIHGDQVTVTVPVRIADDLQGLANAFPVRDLPVALDQWHFHFFDDLCLLCFEYAISVCVDQRNRILLCLLCLKYTTNIADRARRWLVASFEIVAQAEVITAVLHANWVPGNS